MHEWKRKFEGGLFSGGKQMDMRVSPRTEWQLNHYVIGDQTSKGHNELW